MKLPEGTSAANISTSINLELFKHTITYAFIPALLSQRPSRKAGTMIITMFCMLLKLTFLTLSMQPILKNTIWEIMKEQMLQR